MLSSGIIVSINPNSASALLIFIVLRHVPEFSRAMTAISSPIEKAERIVIFNAIKHFPE